MLFVVVIPTAEYEQQIVYGVLLEEPSSELHNNPSGKITKADK